ncbi:hypothetical protein SpCBS45565_g06709 [Spizellomyces sp. 'palustris']|nr:hypothetical protein SpCBS45565_g06709 [Spizellomyces sp. 'palustris']
MLGVRTLARASPRAVLVSVRRGHGHAHAPRGFEPSGYFLGRPNGTKRDWYWWEPLWYFGYYGTFATFFIFQAFSTRPTPTEAAKLEAHRRLAERGETFGWPFPADYGLVKKDTK